MNPFDRLRDGDGVSFVFAPLFAKFIQLPLMSAAKPGSLLEAPDDRYSQRLQRHPACLDHPGDRS